MFIILGASFKQQQTQKNSRIHWKSTDASDIKSFTQQFKGFARYLIQLIKIKNV